MLSVVSAPDKGDFGVGKIQFLLIKKQYKLKNTINSILIFYYFNFEIFIKVISIIITDKKLKI